MSYTYDISNIVSDDYQNVIPEDFMPAPNVLATSKKVPFPLLRYMVDLENSYNQPSCHNTCSTLVDVTKPNTVYDYNGCMISCEMSGTSYAPLSHEN